MKKRWIFASAVAAVVSALDASPAAAQTCKDPWVTQAIREVTRRAPQGSGNSGECNIDRYGAGSWTGYPDLKTRVQKSYLCRDPWIGQVIFYTYRRNPYGSGTSGECNIYVYGNGSWNGYMDLAAKVKQSIGAMSSAGRRFDHSGNLVDLRSGRVVLPSGQVRIIASNGVVAAGGGNVVAAGGANAVAAGGANAVAAGGANAVAAGGANVVAAGGLNMINLAGGSVIAAGRQ